MNFRNAFNAASNFAKEHPVLTGIGLGTAAAALPVISLTGIVCGPIIGGVAGFVISKRKDNNGPGR